MITLLVTIALGALIGIWVGVTEEEYWDGFFTIIGNIIWICVQAVFGGMIGMVIGIIIASPFPMKTHLEKRQIIIENLQDGNSIHGSFFLGIGSVDGSMKYTYYTREGDLYELNQMDANKVKVRYTNGRPRITFNKRVQDKDSWINNWAIDWDLVDCTDYVIEVPKGSIKSDFTLDAK